MLLGPEQVRHVEWQSSQILCEAVTSLEKNFSGHVETQLPLCSEYELFEQV